MEHQHGHPENDPEDTIVCSECGFENTTDFLECVSCGNMLGTADIPEDAGDGSVEVFSTWDAELAAIIRDELKASGVECKLLPLTVRVPSEQAARAEEVLAAIRRSSREVPPGAETDELLCPGCEEPYKIEDYDPEAVRIYCTTCKEELPRHAPRRFGGGS